MVFSLLSTRFRHVSLLFLFCFAGFVYLSSLLQNYLVDAFSPVRSAFLPSVRPLTTTSGRWTVRTRPLIHMRRNLIMKRDEQIKSATFSCGFYFANMTNGFVFPPYKPPTPLSNLFIPPAWLHHSTVASRNANPRSSAVRGIRRRLLEALGNRLILASGLRNRSLGQRILQIWMRRVRSCGGWWTFRWLRLSR